MNPATPITEADLHAWVDGQLSVERGREIEGYLATRPDEAERLDAYRAQKRELHALFDPVLDEPLPQRVLDAARPRAPGRLRAVAAGLAIALLGGAAGWALRGNLASSMSAEAGAAGSMRTASTPAGEFAHRAAVAHAVYSPDARRPVEVSAEHEDQLVAWLSKRMGTPMKPPHLQALGYALEGGRLLPGGRGPVAQFMYHDGAGTKLTLYLSNDIGSADRPARAASAGADSTAPQAAFRFAQEGAVNVFYWVDGRFGYALSSAAGRDELARVANAVYRELQPAR